MHEGPMIGLSMADLLHVIEHGPMLPSSAFGHAGFDEV